MRQGLKDTQIATTAAKDSVIAQTNEFRAAHRPEIRIKHLVLADEIWDGKPIIVNLTCVNHGTCDATLCQLGLKYFVVKKGADLPINTAISHVREFGGAKLVCGRNFPIPDINVCRILTPEESIDIREGRSELYCVGWISFLDDAERMRITGFCRVLCFLQDAWADLKYCRFRRFDDPDYEYED